MIDPETLKIGDVIECMPDSNCDIGIFMVSAINNKTSKDLASIYPCKSHSTWTLYPERGGEVYHLLYNLVALHERAMKQLK